LPFAITVQPTAEPVTIDAVKADLRLVSTDDDALIATLITTARAFAESVTGWSLAPKSYCETRDGFPCVFNAITLFRPPVVSVESVQYLDDTYTWQTWDPSGYWVALANVPALIVPKIGMTYPCTVAAPGSVQVNYTSGMSPHPIHLKAIQALAVHMYSHPELVTSETMRELPLGISTMLATNKANCSF
jgi:uncharacterized phiE125 gp8 family phage protein